MVARDVPAPVIEAGLKLTVTPAGAPDDDKATAELNPPDAVVVTVTVPLDPRVILLEVGETAIVNVPTLGAFTVSVTVVVLASPAPAAVTVSVYVPVATVDATVSPSVDVPEPGAAIEAGLNVAVTPVGAPLTDSVTAELNVPPAVVVMVELPLPPCTTETAAGEALAESDGVVAAPTNALNSPVFGLPHPVTRS